MPWDVVRGEYQTVNPRVCAVVLVEPKAASMLASI